MFVFDAYVEFIIIRAATKFSALLNRYNKETVW